MSTLADSLRAGVILRITGGLLLAAATSACLIPEEFSATVTIEEDGAYSFAFNGTAVDLISLTVASEGESPPGHDASLEELAEEIAQEPGFESVEYVGNGRFELSYQVENSTGSSMTFIEGTPYFRISSRDGLFEVGTVDAREQELNQLRQIGATIDGQLSVKVPRGMEVIEHNADRTPRFFGLFGDYEWDIQSFDTTPLIRIRTS